MSKTNVHCSLYERVRNANGNRCIYTGCSVQALCIFIEYLLNANNIITYYRYVYYDILSTTRGGLPFFSHSHVTDRLLPAKAARCMMHTSYIRILISQSTLPSHRRRSISAQIPRTSLADHRSSRLYNYVRLCTVSTNDHTSPGRPTIWRSVLKLFPIIYTNGEKNYDSVGYF